MPENRWCRKAANNYIRRVGRHYYLRAGLWNGSHWGWQFVQGQYPRGTILGMGPLSIYSPRLDRQGAMREAERCARRHFQEALESLNVSTVTIREVSADA